MNFPAEDIRFMDELRYYRNGTKYYGTILSTDYAIKVRAFTDRSYPLLRKLIGEADEKGREGDNPSKHKKGSRN